MKCDLIWDKAFKNEPSESCGRQPLQNFTWSILEYFVPNDIPPKKIKHHECGLIFNALNFYVGKTQKYQEFLGTY